MDFEKETFCKYIRLQNKPAQICLNASNVAPHVYLTCMCRVVHAVFAVVLMTVQGHRCDVMP